MPRASTVNHISWQSRIWNKWNLPSAPVPGHFPSLMTVVTLQAQYCSPALQWQKSPVEMPLPSPCAFPNKQCGQDQIQQISGHAKAASHLHCVTRIICDLLYSIPVPHWALSLPAGRAVLALSQLCKFPSIRNLRVSGGFSEVLQHHHCRQWS